ncbi:SDR family oxidoreductase [Mycobacterium sp. 3519A]|uniref:SDR family oxidoreductase n=1 Tax=Mycobacterium sp. 3519A TaxID=2057184 RepID=UPI000C7CC08F|nr:SDR family oxidoreductase [Mycobacterium sp. 3519A]
MTGSLRHQRVLVVGRSSGIAHAVALSARAQGADVVVAGRNTDALAAAYDDPGITAEAVDLTDDASIAALAKRLGSLDHVVTTASARARGALADLERNALRLSLDTKVLGPVMLAKHLSPQMNPGGSVVLFSGVSAFKATAGFLGVAITNGAVDYLTRSLAVELAPIRVNAISPGVIDTGAWDAMGVDRKKEFFEQVGDTNPSGRIGTVDDIAHAVLFAMTSTFMTGMTLKIDGGEPLV